MAIHPHGRMLARRILAAAFLPWGLSVASCGEHPGKRSGPDASYPPLEFGDGGVIIGGTAEEQATAASLRAIADAFAAFYAAELRWPLVSGDWNPRSHLAGPAAFTTADTALFDAPGDLPSCTTESRAPCWRGPFMRGGTSLGAPPWLDAWDNPLMYALIPTNDTGAGVSIAPHGAIVLWSVGPDGIDQTGCTAVPGHAPPCTLSLPDLVAGESQGTSDDIVLVVGPALEPLTFTEKLLGTLATSYRAFHRDTGVWPFGPCAWNPAPMMSQQINAQPFGLLDTVLSTLPSVCQEFQAPSWEGSYLWSDVVSLADAPMLDGWYHPLMYAYIRPEDGWGGGTTTAPNGAIVVWSTGPDGIDQTGCSGGRCALNISDLATGHSSIQPSDDIIVYVSQTGSKD